jgi:hypothetical protein
VAGTAGSLQADGPDLGAQTVTLTTATGIARPVLEGKWFNDGFRGTMGELLCAIEEGREPLNAARENLFSLALAFAAVRSRIDGQGGRGRRGPAAGKLRGRKTRFSVREICRFPTRKTAVLLPVFRAENAALRSSR